MAEWGGTSISSAKGHPSASATASTASNTSSNRTSPTCSSGGKKAAAWRRYSGGRSAPRASPIPLTNVQRFVAELRREGPPATGRPRTALTKPHGPPPWLVAAIVLRRPEKRTDEQGAYLKQLRTEDATIATAVDLAEDFLVMLRRREGERLAAWLDTAEASGIGDLARFAAKLRTDHGGGAGRVDAAPQQRADGGARHETQTRQAPGLRPGEGRPPAQAPAAGGVTDAGSRRSHRRAYLRIISFAGEPACRLFREVDDAGKRWEDRPAIDSNPLWVGDSSHRDCGRASMSWRGVVWGRNGRGCHDEVCS